MIVTMVITESALDHVRTAAAAALSRRGTVRSSGTLARHDPARRCVDRGERTKDKAERISENAFQLPNSSLE